MVAAAAIATLVSVFGVAAPAPAAYPTTSFYVSYGNSFIKGEVIWYNRSVGIQGLLRAASGCKYGFAWGWAGSYDTGAETAAVCTGDLTFSGVALSGFPAGGASRVRIRLMDTNLGSVGSDICTRTGCSSE